MTNKQRAYLYLIITFCAWGSLYVVSKFLLGKIPVLTVLLMRYVISGSVLWFVLKKRKPQKIEKKDYKYIFFIGFFGYFLAIGAQLIGTKLANASISSLINAMNPVTIMLVAAIVLKEKLTVKKVVCIILALIGVYIIMGGVKGGGQALGILFAMLSVTSWSFVSVTVRKITQKYDSIQVTTYAILIAAFCTLPFSLIELVNTQNVQVDWRVVIALLYIGLVCTALSHVLWNRSLSIIEAGTCSSFYPLQPLVSVLLGWMFLGEVISMNFVIGAMLIIGGVFFSIIKE